MRLIIFFVLILLKNQALKAESQFPTTKKLDYNINMLICYGQSLSVGGNATDQHSNLKNILSFVGGCNEWAFKLDINDSISREKYYGKEFTTLSTIENKSHPPIAAIALTWMELLEQENQINLSEYNNQFILSTPGYSGTTIEELSKGTEYYSRLLMSVGKAYEFSSNMDKTFGVPCLFWVQGEANIRNTEEEYYEKLKTLFLNLNEDIKKITHQKKDVVFITYQTAPVIGKIPYPSKEQPTYYEESGPSFAQLRISKEKNNVYMGGAMYQYDYGDIWHPKDRAVVGVQLGIIAKRIISDKKKLKTFSPSKYKVVHKENKWYLSVKFDVPVAPMRFDTTKGKWHNLNGKQKNFGFKIKNADGEDIISKEPIIIKGNTLVFECKENPQYAVMSYATDGHYGGGNLCDSQNIIINNKNIDYIIDNFCPSFDKYIIE